MQSQQSLAEATTGRLARAVATGTIILATDGGDSSAGALITARELASRLGAHVEIVSILEPTNVVIPPLTRVPRPLHRGATRVQDRRDRIRALCRQLFPDQPPCPTRLLIGDPPASIARAAQSHGAQLIVTGRVPHGKIERSMRRETPLATARAGRLPVLSVQAAATELPRRVVVAVGSGEAAAMLAPIARALLHEALVVHLVAVRRSASPPWGEERHDGEEQQHREAHAAFERVTAAWTLPDEVPVETHVLTGEPGATITSFAQVAGADLVVIGQRHRTRAPHLPHADLATRIFRTVACSTLIVPVERHSLGALQAATSISTAARDWPALLREFGRRNLGRGASITIDEAGDPPRVLVQAWTLSGVACDAMAGAITISLADPSDVSRHLSHVVAQPTVVAVHDPRPGFDEMLVIGYAGGQLSLALS